MCACWLTVAVLSFPVLQMFDWIMHNKGLFLAGYTEIGNNHPHAMELQTQHNHFAMNCMVRHTEGGALPPTRSIASVYLPIATTLGVNRCRNV